MEPNKGLFSFNFILKFDIDEIVNRLVEGGEVVGFGCCKLILPGGDIDGLVRCSRSSVPVCRDGKRAG